MDCCRPPEAGYKASKSSAGSDHCSFAQWRVLDCSAHLLVPSWALGSCSLALSVRYISLGAMCCPLVRGCLHGLVQMCSGHLCSSAWPWGWCYYICSLFTLSSSGLQCMQASLNTPSLQQAGRLFASVPCWNLLQSCCRLHLSEVAVSAGLLFMFMPCN